MKVAFLKRKQNVVYISGGSLPCFCNFLFVGKYIFESTHPTGWKFGDKVQSALLGEMAATALVPVGVPLAFDCVCGLWPSREFGWEELQRGFWLFFVKVSVSSGKDGRTVDAGEYALPILVY